MEDNAVDATGFLTSVGGVTVLAGNHGYVGGFAIAGSKVTNGRQSSSPASADPPKGGAGGSSGSNGTSQANSDLGQWQSKMGSVLKEMKSAKNPSGSDNAKAPASVAESAEKPANQSKDALAVSGSIAVNVVIDNARAYFRSVGALQTGKLTVSSMNDSTVISLAGAVSYASSGDSTKSSSAIGGAIGVNYIAGTTEAFIDGTDNSALPK